MESSHGIITVDVMGRRYSASFALSDDQILVSTGLSRVTAPVGCLGLKHAAEQALRALVEKHPDRHPSVILGCLGRLDETTERRGF